MHDVVRDRMVGAIEEWAAKAPGDLVVFSHGSSARIGIMGLVGAAAQAPDARKSWQHVLVCALDGVTPASWTLERHNVGVGRAAAVGRIVSQIVLWRHAPTRTTRAGASKGR